MDASEMTLLLEAVRDGSLGIDDALVRLKEAPFADLGFAKVDTHRHLRTGVSEVIFGQGKTPAQIVSIARRLRESSPAHVLITRLSGQAALEVGKETELEYHEDCRVGIIRGQDVPPLGRGVVVATGGTSDIPVAEEAALTAEVLGNMVTRVYDVGVAGIHRTLAHMSDFLGAGAVIAIAGMEGALASVIGGLCECPVIAVPTSVGYGASFGGLAALLSMLNSCASGVGVVNIDNGFGAGYLASLINRGAR